MPSHIYIGYDDRFADILMDPSRHVRRTTVAVLVLVRSKGSIDVEKLQAASSILSRSGWSFPWKIAFYRRMHAD